MDEENRFFELSTEETQEIGDNTVAVTTKKTHKFRLYNGTYQLSFPYKIEKFQIRAWRFFAYMTTTNFTLMLQNGLLVLVAPNFRNRSKKRQKKN